jgi:hypothetical protein
LPYHPKVVVDFEEEFRITIGPDTAVSIIDSRVPEYKELVLCYSIGNKEATFYNANDQKKWHLFYIPELGYEYERCVNDVKKELIRLIKCVHERADLVAKKVGEKRKKYLEKQKKYLEEKKKSPAQ